MTRALFRAVEALGMVIVLHELCTLTADTLMVERPTMRIYTPGGNE